MSNKEQIIAMRYNDVVNGTNIIENVLVKYKAAWAEKGMISENGLFRRFYAVRRAAVINFKDFSHSA